MMINLDIDNVLKALRCITGSQQAQQIITPTIIKEAEHALLSWENSNPSTYAILLLQVLTTTTATTAITQDHTIDSSSTAPRLAAALSLKACIGRKWKDRGRLSKKEPLNLIDDSTKEQIRNVLLSMITTGASNGNYINDRNVSISLVCDKSLMTIVSSTLAKIANLDLPLEFKALIPTLVGYSIGSFEAIDSSVAVETRFNTANALEFILADICTKRLLIFKKYIVSIASKYLSDIINKGLIFCMDCLIKANDDSNLLRILEYAMIMTKIIHHLIISSLSSIFDNGKRCNNKEMNQNTNNNSEEFEARKSIDRVFELFLEYIPLLCKHLRESSFRQSTRNVSTMNDNSIDDSIKALLGEFYSLVVEAQKAHAISFSRFLDPFLTLFYSEIEWMASMKQVEVKFAIPQIMFLANVISCSHYEPDESMNESMQTWRSEVTTGDHTRRAITSQGDICIDPNSVNNAVQNVWRKFLTIERIHNLVDLCLYYMTLNQSHLTAWIDDSESFYFERLNASAEEDIIACAQLMYIAMLESKCKPIVLDKISSYICRGDEQLNAASFESENTTDGQNYESILFWDTVYTATGLSLDSLKSGGFDLNNWFASTLSQVINILFTRKKSLQILKVPPILRFRLLWIIGCGATHMNNCQFVVDVLVSIINNFTDQHNDAAVELTAIQTLNIITYDPPEMFLAQLHEPAKLIDSLYALSSNFEEVESKVDTLVLIQQLLTTFMINGKNIDCNTMMQTVVRPLDSIWNSSVDNYLIIRSSVVAILGLVASFGKEHANKLHPMVFPLLDHALDPANEEDAFLVKDLLDLWVTLIRIAMSYDSNFGCVFRRVEDLLRKDLEHVRKLMIITEAYILVGGEIFWKSYSSSLESILKIVVGNLSSKGNKYLNLVFEALLKTFPVEGSSMLLSSELVNTMTISCAETYHNVKNCETYSVIHVYLTVISRIVLSSPAHMKLIVVMLDTFVNINFGLVQLVNLYLQEFHKTDPTRQKLWTLSLATLLFPQHPQNPITHDIISIEDFNHFFRCCLTVLELNEDLIIPYSIEYDSEEEALTLQQENYKVILNSITAGDVALKTNFRSFYLNTIQSLKFHSIYQNHFQSIDQALMAHVQNIAENN